MGIFHDSSDKSVCARASEELLTETGAAVHVHPWAKVALAVVGAPGVDTFVLAAPVMDLALVDIWGGGGVGKGKGQRQESGRQMGDKLAQFDKIFPIMEREKKKASTWRKAQMCCQNQRGT